MYGDLLLPVWVEEEDTTGAPETVEPVDQLPGDVRCLRKLFSGDEPARQEVRGGSTLVALYILGDASGNGFGSAIYDGAEVAYRAAA